MRDAALRDMSAHFLVIAFIPFQAAEIRQKVKHWGDTGGFVTQCIVSARRHPPRVITSCLCSIIIAAKRSAFRKGQVR